MGDNDERIELRPFEGKRGTIPPDTPVLSVHGKEGSALGRLNTYAKSKLGGDTDYADFYVSQDPPYLGIKPVSGQDVTGRSYKITSQSMAFQNLLKRGFGVEPPDTGSWQIEGKYDSDRDMLVFNLHELLADLAERGTQ